MKLEVGKYYRSSDGRKVGPMRLRSFERDTWDVDQFKYPLPTPLGVSLWDKYGVGDEGVHLVVEWEEETTMDNKITMEGKYAYRKDPFTQVRILCVDRPKNFAPVTSLDEGGFIRGHHPHGGYNVEGSGNHGYDLVPLQVKLPDLWGLIYPDGKFYPAGSKEQAEDWFNSPTYDGILAHYIPAPDQTS